MFKNNYEKKKILSVFFIFISGIKLKKIQSLSGAWELSTAWYFC